jgi:twitching motility two-component system response regulator PilG
VTTDAEVFGTADARGGTDLLDRAILAAKAGDKERARRVLLDLTDNEPDNELAHVWLASVARGQEEALAHLRRAWQLNPSRAEVVESLKTMLLRIGVAAAEAGDDVRARAALEECSTVDPGYDRAWLWLASVAGSPPAAMGHLRKVLQLEPHHPLASSTLERLLLHEGMEAAMAGDRGLATEYLTEASQLNPGNEQVWALLAQLAPDDDARVEALERALAVSPDSERLRATLASVRSRQEVEERLEAEALHEAEMLVAAEAREWATATHSGKLEADEEADAADAAETANPVEDADAADPVAPADSIESAVFEHADAESVAESAAATDAPPGPNAASVTMEPLPATPTTIVEPPTTIVEPPTTIVEPPTAKVQDAPAKRSKSTTDAAFTAEPTAPPTAPRTADRASGGRSAARPALDRSSIEWPEIDLVTPRHPTTIVVAQQAPRRPAAEPAAATEQAPDDRPRPARPAPPLGASPPVAAVAPPSPKAEKPRPTVVPHASFERLAEAAKVPPVVSPTALPTAPPAVPPPLMPETTGGAWTLTPPADGATRTGGQHLVMVIDDSPTIRKAVSIGLEAEGYHVVTAVDGLDALRKLEETQPDLILLDITMPGIDGYKLCRKVRANERTKAIPVVMLSGKDGFFDKVRGRMAGCTDYITKPFASRVLLDTVAQHCGAAR